METTTAVDEANETLLTIQESDALWSLSIDNIERLTNNGWFGQFVQSEDNGVLWVVAGEVWGDNVSVDDCLADFRSEIERFGEAD